MLAGHCCYGDVHPAKRIETVCVLLILLLDTHSAGVEIRKLVYVCRWCVFVCINLNQTGIVCVCISALCVRVFG